MAELASIDSFRIPFPRATPDGRIIIDELCTCGRRRSQHAGIGPAFGHGSCKASRCPKFSWADHVFAPARVAFAAVISERGYEVGLAHENQDGYEPRPDLGIFESWDASNARARELNDELGLEARAALDVVLSSMRGRTVRHG